MRIKLFIGIFLIAFVASGATGSYFYFQAQAALFDSIRAQLKASAQPLALLIDGDVLETLTVPEQMESPEYLYIQGLLDAFVRFSREYLFAYTMRLDQGQVRFIVDSSSSDVDGDGVISPWEMCEPVGALYPDPPETLLQGFVMPAVDAVPHHDEHWSTMSGYAPIYNSTGNPVGLVGVDMSLARIESKLASIRTAGSVSLISACLLALLLGFFFSRRIFRPLARLQTALRQVGDGDYTQRLSEHGRDEIARTARSFNRMVMELEEKQRIKSGLGKIIGREAARHVLDNQLLLGGEMQTATILVCDLRGFSRLSEVLPPKMLVALINDYFTEMVAVIQSGGGMVDKFVGDMVLAVFGHPAPLDNAGRAALQTACRMIERCDALNELLHLNSGMRLVNSIGLHAGPVLAGTIGSPERMEYTVMGHTVNVAVRIEKLTRSLNTRLATSADLVTALDTDDHGLIFARQETPEGMHTAIDVYVLP